MLKLFNSTPSGNCYKLRLLLAHLDTPYETVEVDVFSGGARPEQLREGNTANRVPMLIPEDGRPLPESNAILWHLAQGTPYVPEDPFECTQMLRWMFFEQNLHEPAIAVNRFLIAYAGKKAELPEPIAFNHRRGVTALEAMEAHLQEHPFFAAGRYTLADIALYAYTHVADQGGFDLAPLTRVNAWLARVCAQPGHVTIDA